MNENKKDYLWGATCAGAAGALAIIFTLAALPKPLDNEILNETAIETLARIDNIEAMVGQQVPMSYDGSEYQIYIQGVSNHTEVNKTPETCYDYRIINSEGITLGIADFITVKNDRYGCDPTAP